MKTQIKIFLISIVSFWGCSNTIETTPYIPSIPTLTIPSSGLTPCVDGFAGVYPCSGYDLQAIVSLETFGANSGNDSWGWTDPQTGKEYAIMGLDDGTAFVDISVPDQPVYLGKLATASVPSSWRDVKVFQNHAFIVSEAANHGMQVFDLTRLRDLPSKQNFTADARFTGFGNAHNIAINEASGFAYVIGSSLYEGGPAFIDVNDPLNPTLEGGFSDESYSHDAHIVTYNGPDQDHHGKEILYGSNSDGGDNNQVVIVDVTDKSAPTLISNMSYSNGGYTHQGWLAEDHQYYYLGDELDEINYGGRTKTLVFDLEDLDNPILHHTYLGATNAIDHNGYTKNNSFFIANYTAGFREINTINIASGAMEEEGFFDTYPSNNNANFNGVWSIYPYFESGVIVISDINTGLYLVKASE
ncbi:MAG: choice-of-anchor B family protein [Flavobacteriaceae bacterium]|nr:choice-of-anchor B family protein [Flavobacteriaceae bacterium]MDO7581955.1 choice-of-anchor B family protein [Flavobacteriaceae bacterium]MDO7591241.1 choice-of-anchor B family protein [Flavobacteriaceae bacterium]MDO7604004.1 choice-of-anchor B family protein [Flavobacteriaceae bacterium]MDO7615604.1 choice-of-anchor B family protein [Flavobacteriaceae bacterium]